MIYYKCCLKFVLVEVFFMLTILSDDSEDGLIIYIDYFDIVSQAGPELISSPIKNNMEEPSHTSVTLVEKHFYLVKRY